MLVLYIFITYLILLAFKFLLIFILSNCIIIIFKLALLLSYSFHFLLT